MQLQAQIVELLERLANPHLGYDQRTLIENLNTIIEKDFSEYLFSLSEISIGHNNNLITRINATIQLKNGLFSRNSKQMQLNKEKWLKLDQQLRMTIFNNIFKLLEEPEFVSAAPLCLSYLCLMESDSEVWLHCISQLLLNVCQENIEESKKPLQLASLTAISYIIEQMASYIDQNLASNILQAVSIGVVSNDAEMKNVASLTLYNVLDCIDESNLESKDYRDEMLKLIIQLKNQNDDQNILTTVYGCLVKVADLYYRYMSEYIEGFYNITSEGMKNKTYDKVVMYSVKFWETVCQRDYEYIKLNNIITNDNNLKNDQQPLFTREALPFIIYKIMSFLDGDEGENYESYSVASFSASCLKIFSKCWTNLTFDHVTTFFNKQIICTEWYNKNSALLAIGSSLEGPSESKVIALLEKNWAHIQECMNHSNEELQDTACWLLIQISDKIPKFVHSKQEQIMPILLKCLTGDRKAVKNASLAVVSLIKQIRSIWIAGYQPKMFTKPVVSHYFFSSSDFDKLIKIFLTNSQSLDISLSITSFISISETIKCLDVESMIGVANSTFEAIYEILTSVIETKESLLSPIFFVIQSIIEVFGKKDRKMCLKIIDFIYALDRDSLITKFDLTESILSLLSTILTVDEQCNLNFEFCFKLTQSALSDYKFNVDATKSALNFISMCIMCLENNFISQLSKQNFGHIINLMVNIVLDSSESCFSVKNLVLDCFSDLILEGSDQLNDYIANIINITLSAINLDPEIAKEDIYYYNYSIQIYCSCMSVLSSLIQTYCFNNQLQKSAMNSSISSLILKELPKITLRLSEIALRLSKDKKIQLAMIGLLGDLTQSFPMPMLKCVQQLESSSDAGKTSSISNALKDCSNGFKTLLFEAKTDEKDDRIQKVYRYTVEQLRKAKIEVV